MSIFRLHILHLLFFLLPVLSWGQDPFYINYDTNDGLPSSESYYALTDTNGLIWIATDRGVCTYDGYQFSTYTTKEGLAYNTNFRIFIDRKQRLWFTGWDGSVSLYENGIFREVPLLENTLYNGSFGYAIQLLFDEEDNVFLVKNHLSSEIKKGVIYRLDAEDFSVSRQSVYDSEDVLWKNDSGAILLQIGDKHLYYDPINQFSVNIAFTDTTYSNWVVGFNTGRVLQFINGRGSSFYSKRKLRVNNFYLDPQNNLWVCRPEGLFLYEQANLELPPRHFFKGLDVTSIIVDREGSYWMTSREKGVFWIPSFQFHSLLRPKQAFEIQQILSVGALPNFLVFGTVNNGIVAIDNQFEFSSQLKGWEGMIEAKRLYASANTIYAKNLNRIEEINGQLYAPVIDKPQLNGQIIKELNNGELIIADMRGYMVLSKNKLDTLFMSFNYEGYYSKRKRKEVFDFTSRIHCIEEIGNTLWLGGLEGLYQLDTKKMLTHTPVRDTAQLMNVRVEDIICIDSQQIWVATIGNGVVYKNGGQHVQLLQRDGLSSNLVKNICLENDSTLWAATNKGLDKIQFQYEDKGISVQSVTNFSTSDGLISNFINDLTLWKEHLWLATNKGINFFRPEELLENKTPPIIYIEEVLAGNELITHQQDCQLKHNENDLVFNFLGICFKKPKNKPFYRYRLKRNEEDAVWYHTDNRSIRFIDLAPGYYTFEVNAQNKNGYWNEQTASFSFNINAHFSDQLWFKSMAGLSIVALVGIWLFYRVRIFQEKEDQKRKLQGAELNALRNQMNPHFIFNSLNSIQSFIFHQDVKQANYYLSKFSKLIRNSLEYSKLEYISIFEEVNYIRSYLELEKLRFEDRFEVRIEVAPEIPVHHYYIPPLLLQPVLENAVKHAFKNISYQGQLYVQFLSAGEGQVIEVVIRDNGRGIKENTGEPQAEQHQSMGLSIIENRIKLLNLNNNAPQASFQFGNRYNSKQEIIGTQASFIIPVKLKKND